MKSQHSSKKHRTCQEYLIQYYCNLNGTIGKNWLNGKQFEDFANFGYSAYNCPQCGCSQEYTESSVSNACDGFTLWHQMNKFDYKNMFVGDYYKIENVTFGEYPVYGHETSFAFALYDGSAWLFAKAEKNGARFEFKFESQNTLCPAKELSPIPWEEWIGQILTPRQSRDNGNIYIELPQWPKITGDIGTLG